MQYTAAHQPIMSSAVVILSTAGSREVAKKLAGKLVSEKLVACVNLQAVTSIYSWNGKINEDEETLMIMKTTQEKVKDVTNFIQANHDYEVPEVIAMPIVGGSEKYLSWVTESTNGRKDEL